MMTFQEMQAWLDTDIQNFIDAAEESLNECVQYMKLKAKIIRKDRGIGLVPSGHETGVNPMQETKMGREKLGALSMNVLV